MVKIETPPTASRVQAKPYSPVTDNPRARQRVCEIE